jgi:hypothetical protein
MIEGYKELLNSIELHKNLYDVADMNYQYYDRIFYSGTPRGISSINYDGMPKGSRNYKDIADTIAEMQRWLHMRDIEEDIIKRLETHKKAIDECINKSDITVKVAQLRALGLTQMQVAELVERSPRQVQRIEKKVSNE